MYTTEHYITVIDETSLSLQLLTYLSSLNLYTIKAWSESQDSPNVFIPEVKSKILAEHERYPCSDFAIFIHYPTDNISIFKSPIIVKFSRTMELSSARRA